MITSKTIFPSGIQNILISDDGTPLLTDFGSVRVAEIFIDSRNKVSSSHSLDSEINLCRLYGVLENVYFKLYG